MNLNAMYKCECGTVLEVAAECECDDKCVPECCGKPAALLKENTVDAAKEKHVPVIEKVEGGYKVKVGSVPHPMTPEHYIVIVELLTDKQVLRQTLTPTDKPEAVFKTDATAVKAREFCNIHGLWTA